MLKMNNFVRDFVFWNECDVIAEDNIIFRGLTFEFNEYQTINFRRGLLDVLDLCLI